MVTLKIGGTIYMSILNQYKSKIRMEKFLWIDNLSSIHKKKNRNKTQKKESYDVIFFINM